MLQVEVTSRSNASMQDKDRRKLEESLGTDGISWRWEFGSIITITMQRLQDPDHDRELFKAAVDNKVNLPEEQHEKEEL